MFSLTTFGQLLKGLPRGTFDKLVERHNADKYCKRFGHWQHLVTMVYAQLSGTTGLRPLEAAFNSQQLHHYHLGVDRLRRSTLADANEKRGDTVFADTVAWLMTRVSGELRKDTRDLLYLLDSTSITLKGREFDRWTEANKSPRTQGMKLHILLAGAHDVPVWQAMSAANVNDIDMARSAPIKEGGLYVFDKGYCDYNWWYRIDQARAKFVTRFKVNAGLRVVEELPIPGEQAESILLDEIVQFKHKHPGGKRLNEYSKPLRRVTVAREGKTPLVLATNDMTASAQEIAQRYKERWGIELFFKWIKQHLKIKQFFGRSEAAVRIQLLTALISYLLVAILKRTHAATSSMWNYLSEIRASLFQRPESDSRRYRRRRSELDNLRSVQPCLI